MVAEEVAEEERSLAEIFKGPIVLLKVFSRFRARAQTTAVVVSPFMDLVFGTVCHKN